jgi:hypothetical protein
LPDPPAEPADPADGLSALQLAGTSVPPHLEGLRRACNQELAEVLAVHKANLLRLHGALSAAKKNCVPAAIDMELTRSRLAEVAGELVGEELDRRGPAERNEDKWPPEMLRERRRRQRRIARAEAEEASREATKKHQVAALEVEHAQKAYDECLNPAQSMGWQIVHYYRRREAAYLRSLTRVHKSGPALVDQLHLGDRDLPSWLLGTNGMSNEEDGDGESQPANANPKPRRDAGAAEGPIGLVAPPLAPPDSGQRRPHSGSRETPVDAIQPNAG